MLKRTAQQRGSPAPPVSEGMEPVSTRQTPEPVEAEHMEQGRPYQAFVENEASRFWQELTQSGSQAEPAPVGIGTPGLPGMIPDVLDRRVGKSHYAVAGQAQHRLMVVRSPTPSSVATASPPCIDSLRRIVEDARWVYMDYSRGDLMGLEDLMDL